MLYCVHYRPYNTKNPFLAPIRVIRELHKGGDRSCMHVELDISGSRLNYVAGDHLALFPANEPRLVERVGELLGADLETVFSLTSTDGKTVVSQCNSMGKFSFRLFLKIGHFPRGLIDTHDIFKWDVGC